MYETTHILVSKNAERLFSLLLLLYPEQYRKKFGQEMHLLFFEMYQEELTTKGSVGFVFLLLQISDITKSVIVQHRDLMTKIGMKKYIQHTLRINKYNMIGFFFLAPFLLMFITDLVSRILQGDLMHYNRPVYHYLSHTPLYWTPILYTIVIMFPLLAIVFNVIPLLQQKRKTVFTWFFVRKNLITLLIILAGIGCISIIKLHDFLPCMIHGMLRGGLAHFSQMFPYCQKA
jgi:hypothetical protein